MSVGRQLRDPVPTTEFNRLSLKVKELTLAGFWYNLRWEDYAIPDKTFFASTTMFHWLIRREAELAIATTVLR